MSLKEAGHLLSCSCPPNSGFIKNVGLGVGAASRLIQLNVMGCFPTKVPQGKHIIIMWGGILWFLFFPSCSWLLLLLRQQVLPVLLSLEAWSDHTP